MGTPTALPWVFALSRCAGVRAGFFGVSVFACVPVFAWESVQALDGRDKEVVQVFFVEGSHVEREHAVTDRGKDQAPGDGGGAAVFAEGAAALPVADGPAEQAGDFLIVVIDGGQNPAVAASGQAVVQNGISIGDPANVRGDVAGDAAHALLGVGRVFDELLQLVDDAGTDGA